ncbi:hypothetical protein [Streptomyces lydicus]|uniref:hypothetical protein n=1 Tax=Streptomyces lydicus TaxID=47763 RepID=UPI003D6760FE
MPYADAVAVVGCPIGTVRSRAARARADLTGCLRSGETCARSAPGSCSVASRLKLGFSAVSLWLLTCPRGASLEAASHNSG